MAERGGRREGAGRPKATIERERHSINATVEEWNIIEKLVDIVRKDKLKCNKVLQEFGIKDNLTANKCVTLTDNHLSDAR